MLILTYKSLEEQVGMDSFLMLFHRHGVLGKKTSKQMKVEYCTNTEKQCRKALLFSDFDEFTSVNKGCQCCDMCRKTCTYVRCESHHDLFYFGYACT